MSTNKTDGAHHHWIESKCSERIWSKETVISMRHIQILKILQSKFSKVKHFFIVVTHVFEAQYINGRKSAEEQPGLSILCHSLVKELKIPQTSLLRLLHKVWG